MKDEIKEMNLSEMLFNRDERLLDYITNLREEKKQLKDGWQQEVYDKNKILNDWLDLKVRNEKAIKELKDTSVDMPSTLLIEVIDYAIHILQGSDKDD